MTINLNVNSNMQNYYVNNTNTDGGGSVMPSHEAEANGYTYGDAVEISLSANAQSYNAEQVPNGERPPVGETVVVWGPVRETSAGGASSFSGWAETNGGDNSEYHYYGDVTAEETPPETQLIDNKPKRAHNERWRDANGALWQHYKKDEALKEVDTLLTLVGAGDVLGAATYAIAKKVPWDAIMKLAGKATLIGSAIEGALVLYRANLELGPEEGDILIHDPNNPYNQYRPIENDGSEEGNWGPNYNQTNSWDM